MSKLLRIAPVVMLFAATTFLAPVVPAKDKNKDKTASAQTTETTGKDAKSHKGKHHEAGQQSDSSSTASTAEKSGTPKN
jgi:hypothetical protein